MPPLCLELLTWIVCASLKALCLARLCPKIADATAWRGSDGGSRSVVIAVEIVVVVVAVSSSSRLGAAALAAVAAQ